MADRREFLRHSASCAAHLALAAAAVPVPLRALFAAPRRPVIAREPFGTLEKVAEGVWALVSDPFGGDRTTLCNGGLIAGRDGVLAIEGFFRPAGARWLAERARELTGRWPTHVAVTHHHADHVDGIAGYLGDPAAPVIRATAHTQETVLARSTAATDADRAAALRDALLITIAQTSTIDLGGRTVRVVPRDGHTRSDVTLELDDPSVVFCGDLLWNGIFPNYVDATPSRLSRQVRALRRPRATTYIPGHGAIADAAAFDRYVGVLDAVEDAARQAHAAGRPPAEAAAEFTLPPALGEWRLFGKVFFERAFTAWERELRG